MPFQIDHIGIAVRSLSEALAFYQSTFACEGTAPETISAEEVTVSMLPALSGRIELLEATNTSSPIARFIDKRGPGIHHVAVKVDDLDATVRNLKATGAKLLNEPRVGAGGHTYVFVHPSSTGGVLLELIENR